ncbi:MAG TPA: hypothetical protein VF331_08675 [Polyangiales bacterium]
MLLAFASIGLLHDFVFYTQLRHASLDWSALFLFQALALLGWNFVATALRKRASARMPPWLSHYLQWQLCCVFVLTSAWLATALMEGRALASLLRG